jgi:hypothetical protein
VTETKDIQPSKMIVVEVDGEKVCVANEINRDKLTMMMDRLCKMILSRRTNVTIIYNITAICFAIDRSY